MTHNPTGRVETHMKGAGVLIQADVEQRTKEIAVINDHDHPTEDDHKQAVKELQNENINLSSEDNTERPMVAATGTHIAADTGHKVKDRKPDDSQMIAEAEVREGVREAEHNTMLTERSEPEKNE